MKFQTKGGYVLPSVILILTLIISTLVYSASLQKSNVEIIDNFKKLNHWRRNKGYRTCNFRLFKQAV